MWRYRLSARDAINLVKKARPSARPNVNFVQQLVEWEAQVVRERGLLGCVGKMHDKNNNNIETTATASDCKACNDEKEKASGSGDGDDKEIPIDSQEVATEEVTFFIGAPSSDI
jgi:hypothetical protein